MREVEDAWRSVAKYVSDVLGEDWDVRLDLDRGQYQPPVGIVRLVGAPAVPAGAAFRYEVTQPMSIELYPNLPEPLDVETSQLEASRVVAKLIFGFRGPGVGDGRPMRVPLWDFEGLPLDAPGQRQRQSNDYMRVMDFGAQLLADPEDPRRARVMVDLRVNWTSAPSGRLDREGKPVRGTHLVSSVQVEIDGS